MPSTDELVRFTSQCGEDRWMAEHWDSLGLPDVGFFVEFGAADGVSSSNTYWLEKSKGWRGLLCEPDPRHVIADRPNCIIERVAIASGPPGIVPFGLDKNDPCLSGIRRPSDCRIEVECIGLSALLEKHSVDRVDLISIDTEGTELDAWQTLDLERWRPQVAIVEHYSWGIGDSLKDTIEMLTKDGYALLCTSKYNCIFKNCRP